MESFKQLLESLRIIPVLTVHSVDEALATCIALQRGGIRAVEITLRSEAALASIAAVRDGVPDLRVAAGTIKSPADLEAVSELGVDFAVSPGLSEPLLQASSDLAVPLLPGIATASELMRGLDSGRDCFKLFPAQAVGGLALLRSLAGPFAEASFCPTGGVDVDNYLDYLALDNVVCVGGSWMVSRRLIEAEQWQEITRLSALAMGEERR